MRRMAASVLVFEAFIALFFGLVAAKLHPSGDWVVALALGAVCVLLAGMMRFRWAYAAGWALQIGFIAAGFLVTDMFFLGAVFAAIWWAGLHYGAKAERIKAERIAAYESTSHEGSAPTSPAQTSSVPTGSARASTVPGQAAPVQTVSEQTAQTVVKPTATSTEHPGVGTR